MKKQNLTEQKMTAEKSLTLTDELLEGVNGGAFHHHKTRHEQKPDWTYIDPEDGSSGVTFTW